MRIRPVPVVFLLLAFMPQLSVIAKKSVLDQALAVRKEQRVFRDMIRKLEVECRNTHIDEFWPRDSRMMSRCAFGCGGNGDLRNPAKVSGKVQSFQVCAGGLI